jgi:exopolysaccharide biosynthesis WecB/TagA/CpsF family protein
MENKKLLFTESNFKQALFKVSYNSKGIYNFINLFGIYWFRKKPIFRESITSKHIINFIDSSIISFYFSLKKFKKIKRLQGPIFTRKFLNTDSLRNSKIMFIGLCSQNDLNFISNKFKIPLTNLSCYDKLPYIAPKLEYKKQDIIKLAKYIKSKKPDFVFICVGNPRQEILAYELNKIIKTNYLVVGAALDFILQRKAEAPKLIRKLGIEWVYRLITDFKYSKTKVWRSFLGLIYLLINKVKIDVRK